MSFSTVQHRFKTSYIKKGLNSTVPVDPLASLDIFGQQRFSIQEPHLTETYSICNNKQNTCCV
ncbi:hypothetical protein C6A34_12495 (plasmid) [Bacillus thuringiensis]|nr:hypothetical protein C6A34_12495 [Bacillus thuringiensis]